MPWPDAVNRPTELAASGVSARVTITAVPSGRGGGLAQASVDGFANMSDPPELRFHDAASLAAANAGNLV
jgi:hypothetical protein